MKKTIFTLFMISLIMLGSSAISMSFDCSKNNSDVSICDNDDEPDFIVKTLDWVPCRCPGWYCARVRISNIGAKVQGEVSVKVKST